MNLVKKHAIITGLIILILLSLLFIIGETSFKITPNQITRYIPPASTQTAAVADFDSNLVAHYTFDDTTNDSAGTNNGTISGGATYVDGKVGRALQFDGVSNYVSVTSASSLNPPSAITIAFWINPSVTNLNNNIIFISKNSHIDYKIRPSGSNGTVQFMQGGSFILTSSANMLAANKWVYVTLVSNSAGTSFYKNGVLWGSNATAYTAPSSSVALQIGTGFSGGLPFILDDVRIYNRALSANEIQDLYNLGTVSTPSVIPTTDTSISTTFVPNTPQDTQSTSDIYISQNAQGDDSGSSCSNSHSVIWANTISNWGTNAAQIKPGNTMHLCGIFSTALNIRGSGNPTSPITVRFEPGAKFSASYWGTNGAINSKGQSYVVIDGNGTGIIEATDNGAQLGNQVMDYGIAISGGTKWEIKGLVLQKLFVHQYGDPSTSQQRASVSIAVTDTSQVNIHDNTISDNYYGVSVGIGTEGLVQTGISVHDNNISRCSTGLSINQGYPGSYSTDGVDIYDNNIQMGSNWVDPANNNHIDGMHLWATAYTSNNMTNVRIFGNHIWGFDRSSGQSTALIYLEYNIVGPKIYNNILDMSVVASGWGAIGIKGNPSGPTPTASNAKIWNNTIIGNGLGGTPILFSNSTGNNVFNNLITGGFRVGPSVNDSSSSITACDYNIYVGGFSNIGWQGLCSDTHSSTRGVTFLSPDDYHLSSTDTTALDAGINLSQYFTTDKDNKSRPSTGPWDIGAYEYTGGGVVQPVNPPVTPSTPGDFNSDGSVNALDFSAMKVYWNHSDTLSTPYDLNKDGIVNTLDYAIMVQNWTG